MSNPLDRYEPYSRGQCDAYKAVFNALTKAVVGGHDIRWLRQRIEAQWADVRATVQGSAVSATPEERLVMAVFQSGCIRCEREFDSIEDTTVVTGLLLHTACLTDDDKLALANYLEAE